MNNQTQTEQELEEFCGDNEAQGLLPAAVPMTNREFEEYKKRNGVVKIKAKCFRVGKPDDD